MCVGGARGNYVPGDVEAQRVIVVDAAGDDVLFEKNADVRGQVASTQKLLTALVIARAGALETRVAAVAEDRECLPFRVDLPWDRGFTRLDLLTCVMVGSANDAANTLARDHAGSVAAFAGAMNACAAGLGMGDSYFANPTGLPDERQYSTARDLARLARVVVAETLLLRLAGLAGFRLDRGDGTEAAFGNRNRLLGVCPVCDGLKTGFTRSAGYCLISTGEVRGQRRIVVLLGGTKESVWRDSRRLLEWSLGL